MTDKQKITAICQECNNQFEYELKPGFPRKYCITCGEIKKASYAAKIPKSDDEKAFDEAMNVPVVRPGFVTAENNPEFSRKVPEKAPESNKNASFYISYAKDIFCAITTGLEVGDLSTERFQEIMQDSIELVNQARKAFE